MSVTKVLDPHIAFALLGEYSGAEELSEKIEQMFEGDREETSYGLSERVEIFLVGMKPR